MNELILVINTGNTSTKIALYNLDKQLLVESIKHSDDLLSSFSDINSQKNFREKLILDFLKKRDIDLNSLKAVAARGGLLRPLESGTYLVKIQINNNLNVKKLIIVK